MSAYTTSAVGSPLCTRAICVHKCVHGVCTYTYTHLLGVYLNACTHAPVLCAYILCVRVHGCVCLHAHIHVLETLSACTCLLAHTCFRCACICAFVFIGMFSHAVCIYSHMGLCLHTHVHVILVGVYVCICIQEFACPYAHVCILICVRVICMCV